jgi:hypothetical protein
MTPIEHSIRRARRFAGTIIGRYSTWGHVKSGTRVIIFRNKPTCSLLLHTALKVGSRVSFKLDSRGEAIDLLPVQRREEEVQYVN